MSERPFLTINPRSRSSLLLTCEHASGRLPPGMPRDRASREALASHWGSDLGAWELARGLAARLRASAVGGRWSRLVIDLNRPVGDPTLIRPDAGGVVLPWNRDLDPDEVERRVLDYHVPYHAEIDRLVVRRLVRGERPLLLAVHSFTPRLGRARRRFDAGVLYDDHRPLARRLVRELRAQGLTVRHNQPYSGVLGMMYAVDRHGSHHRLPCLEIEVNQARLGTVRDRGRMLSALVRAIGPAVAAAREPDPRRRQA